MLTITTKYMPATDCRGARIKATYGRTSVSIPFPFEVSSNTEQHFMAVRELLPKIDLDINMDQLAYGSTPDGLIFVSRYNRAR